MNLDNYLRELEEEIKEKFLVTREKEGCQAFSEDCGKKDENGMWICPYCQRWNGQQREIQVYEFEKKEAKKFLADKVKEAYERGKNET